MNEERLTVTSPEHAAAALAKEVSSIEVKAGEIVIVDNDDYEFAGEFGKELKRKAAQVTEFFKPMKEQAHQAHKAICDREKAVLAPLANAEKVVKAKMSAYVTEQERKRKEQEEALRRAAEAERERLLAEAVEAEATGDSEAAEMAIADAVVMDEASRYSIPEAEKPKVSGVSASKDWQITMIDANVVPIEFSGMELRPVDEKAVLRLIRASKGSIQIPGVAYKEVAKMSFRR